MKKREERITSTLGANASIQCSVTPVIETHRLPDLDYAKLVTLSVAPMAGDVGTANSTTGLIDGRPTLTFPLKLSGSEFRETSLVVDHPDAMRAITRVRGWSAQNAGLAAAPTVELEPIGCRIALGRSRIKVKKDRSQNAPSPFNGTATLVDLREKREVRVIDSVGVSPGANKRRPLRFAHGYGDLLILGVPNSEAAAADLIDLSAEFPGFPNDGSLVSLPIGLRGRTPRPILLEVVGPFGELVKGATVTANVDPKYVARWHSGREPTRFGRFVFVKNAGAGSGQLVRGGEGHPLNLGLARASATDTSGANGRVSLSGIDARVYQFEVQSPFGDTALTEFQVVDTEVPQVTVAPMAGIEVHCPLVWRSDDAGRAAWASAKVNLSGRSKMLPFSKDDARALSPRRFLVRANSQTTISCLAKGTPKMTREVRSAGQRQVTAHFPEPPKAAPSR